MQIRNLNSKREKWKYFHIFTANQVFNKVFCCVIDRTLWFNGKDGYFYSYIKTNDNYSAPKIENVVMASCRTLEFVTNNMRTGYNMAGMPICHRKNCYGRHKNPLRGVTIVKKGKSRNA